MARSRVAVLFVRLVAGSAGFTCAAWRTVRGDLALRDYMVYAAAISQMQVEPQTHVFVGRTFGQESVKPQRSLYIKSVTTGPVFLRETVGFPHDINNRGKPRVRVSHNGGGTGSRGRLYSPLVSRVSRRRLWYRWVRVDRVT